jgi:aminoethylphosphonate catabolism LysR family transcriptional regulator
MRHSQLRAFHAVATAGGFTAAAKARNVSQPTLTAQVRALEREFGVELFFRRGRRVELTAVGQGLLEITRRLADDEAEAATFLNERRELKSGHLHVGAVGPYHVTDMLAAFNRRYPGIYVSVAIGNSRDVVRDLRDWRTEVAVLAHIDPDPELLAIEYRRHRVVVFVHPEHPFWRRRSIRIAELEGQPLIQREQGSTTRRALEAALAKARVKPRVVMEIGGREAIRFAVARGIGIGAVSEAEFVPDPRLRAIPIADAEVYTYAHVVCLRARQNARLVGAFLDVVGRLGAPMRRRVDLTSALTPRAGRSPV